MKTWGICLLGLLVVSCDGQAEAPDAAAVQETTARGCGRSHEEAYAEACAQAVSQVCGIRVDKAVLSVGRERGAVGATTFSGALKSVEELSSERGEDGSYEVTVRAEVCPPPDPFAGRVALALPRLGSIERSLGQLRGPVAHRLALCLDDTFRAAADSGERFVVLNRDSGDADAERKLADSSAARVEEQGKAQGLKVADYVLELQIPEASEEIVANEYEIAQTVLYKGTAHIEYSLRLVETATNGIVSTERGRATASCTAARSGETCAAKLENALSADLTKKITSSVRTLLNKCPRTKTK